MPKRRTWIFAALGSVTAIALAAMVGCGGSGSGGQGASDGGSDATTSPDHASDVYPGDANPSDARSNDVGPNDATADGNLDGGSAEADAQDGGGTTYNDITSSSFWSTFDTSTVDPGAKGFWGATFDGRYIYLAPYSNVNGVWDGVVARYDTQGTFTAASSWSTFDTSTVNPSAQGFEGATFDGRYVYFVPQYDGVSHDGVVTRYDTQGSFTASSSWSTFDASTVNDAGAGGFVGATFDGRYAYFVPFGNGIFIDGIVARYDTQASFASGGSWSTFDTSVLSTTSYVAGFAGAVFDGRYVYLSPYGGVPLDGGVARDGIVARYDTSGAFTVSASWSTFDTTTLNSAARGFIGAAFDGRYVYLVPYDASFADGGSFASGLLARYDTQGPFGTAASWSTFDTTTLDPNARGFLGAAFDGRYVYLIPNGYLPVNGIVARYDTLQSFGAASSWSTFDTTTLNASAAGFHGAVFDGQYLYLIPYGDTSRSGVVARFDAKTPPSMPNLPAFHGSFF